MSDSVLLGKYERSLLIIRELEQERDKYRKDYETLESENKKLNKSMKNLCETILKKKNVKKDDNEVAWFRMGLPQMIDAAQTYIDSYFQSIKDNMNRMLEINSEMEVENQKLRNQMEEEEKEFAKKLDETIKVKDDVIQELRKRLATGRVDEETLDKIIEPAKLQKENINMPLNDSVSIQIEDSDGVEEDVVEATEVLYGEKEIAITVPKGIKVKASEKMKNTLKSKIQDIQEDRTNVIESYAKELSERQRYIIRVIGETGFSEMSEILNEIRTREPTMTESSIKASLHDISQKSAEIPESLIEICKFSTAGAPRFSVYKLNETGKDIFRYLFSKDPVPSEAEIIVKDHTSLEHGYGIKKTALLIKELKFVKAADAEVHYLTRASEFRIKTGDKTSYIPDIVIVFNNNGKTSKLYIEYETGKCHDLDLIAKCNKMSIFSKSINIIVPNNEAKANLIKKVEKWKDSLPKDGFTNPVKKRVTVRINTFYEIRDGDCSKKIDWTWTKEVTVLSEKKEDEKK